ncbi:hypothetical protein QNM99_03765 [Pseudomonas sp. PCH446]
MGGTATVAGRGRKPKPTAQKKLAGNPGKRALNHDEPSSQPSQILIRRVAERARGHHVEDAYPELLREKVVALTDLHNVEAFCTAYDKWRMSEEAVQKFGIVVESSRVAP